MQYGYPESRARRQILMLLSEMPEVAMPDRPFQYLLHPLPLTGGGTVSRIMPGPMEGIMHPLFCKAVSELGLIDFWITPFLRISTDVPRDSRLRHFILPFTETGLPVIVQLMGNNPELIAAAAARFRKLGVAGINLNFACPSKQVISSGAGGSLLRKPELMRQIIEQVASACPGFSLSVKLRTGYDDSAEMERILERAVSGVKLDFIAMHFRTVKEMYRKTDQGFERIVRAVKLVGDIPLIANGDIFSAEDATAMFRATGCAGIMIARGLLKNPFLSRHIRQICGDADIRTTTGDGRTIFFNKLLDIARRDPGKYWSRPQFMELANYMWGSSHPCFEVFKQLSDKEFLSYSVVEQ
jgi:tRNA-dihydrouridine synthase